METSALLPFVWLSPICGCRNEKRIAVLCTQFSLRLLAFPYNFGEWIVWKLEVFSHHEAEVGKTSFWSSSKLASSLVNTHTVYVYLRLWKTPLSSLCCHLLFPSGKPLRSSKKKKNPRVAAVLTLVSPLAGFHCLFSRSRTVFQLIPRHARQESTGAAGPTSHRSAVVRTGSQVGLLLLHLHILHLAQNPNSFFPSLNRNLLRKWCKVEFLCIFEQRSLFTCKKLQIIIYNTNKAASTKNDVNEPCVYLTLPTYWPKPKQKLVISR